MDDLNENAETGFVVEEVNQVIKVKWPYYTQNKDFHQIF